MAVTASPSIVYVYPVASSNAGQPTVTVALSQSPTNTGGFTVSNPSPSICTATISGSTLTVSYVSPLTPANAPVPVTLTITGDSAQTIPVYVYSFGVLTLTNLSPPGSSVGSFSASEPGYAGPLTIDITPALVSIPSNSGTGPNFGPVLTTPISPGDAVVTVTDDHGGAAQTLLTVYSGSAQNARPIPIGYPTAGAWFDFLHPDAEGLPTVGEIRGMDVTGFAPLRGPNDLANFVWCAGNQDQVAQFGIGFGDMGQAIQVQFAGKSDFFFDELGDAAPTAIKNVDWVQLSTSVPQNTLSQQLTFSVIVTTDFYSAIQSFGVTSLLTSGSSANALVGTAVVGTAIVGGGTAKASFQVTKAAIGQGGRGRVLQSSFQETSIFGWTILGFTLRMSSQEETLP